jgi:hypothetical protein
VFAEVNLKMNLEDYNKWHQEYVNEVSEEFKQIQKDA